MKPDFFAARKLLHHVQRRKMESHGVDIIKYSIAWGYVALAGLFYLLQRDFKVMQMCEYALIKNPHNSAALQLLGSSCYRAQLYDAAVEVLEKLMRQKVKKIDTLVAAKEKDIMTI